MTKHDGPTYCGQCGSPMQPEDQFCGSCGAVVLPPAPQAEQVVPEPTPTSRNTPYAPRRRKRFWVNAAAISLLLLISVGAVAALALNSGRNPLGSSDPQAADDLGNESSSNEGTESTASTSSNASPAPAFDETLPTLRQRTDAQIMLPAELPDEFENVGINEITDGDMYVVSFLSTPPDKLVDTWSRAESVANLTALPESEYEQIQDYEATSTEDVELPDGTEAKLSYMEPAKEMVNYGPHWQGTFDRGGYTYVFVLSGTYGKEILEQALSTMVLVRGPLSGVTEGSTQTTQPEATSSADTGNLQAGAEQAAGDYYRASGSQDWDYTYDHLDSPTQGLFTREEWSQKNQWFADQGTTIYNIESVNIGETSQEPFAEVEVRLTGEDGSSSIRTTYFVLKNREWKHRFGQEEIDLFKPGIPFDDWVDE